MKIEHMEACPWCQSKRLIVTSSDDTWIECGDCGLRGPAAKFNDTKEAVRRWNDQVTARARPVPHNTGQEFWDRAVIAIAAGFIASGRIETWTSGNLASRACAEADELAKARRKRTGR